jgi:hypothetical protein
VTVLLLLATVFARWIGLRADGAWYSGSWAHRLQTEAFFRGTFALQPVPNGQMADWAWGNGSQQVWGLGVPFLRMPLEALGKLAGGVGFPDRVMLLLAFTAVAATLSAAFAGTRAWERTCLLLLTAFAPAFVTLCRTRLAVYEEASAYACLWALLLAALLLRLAAAPSGRRLLWLCALSGFAPFFRPTLIFTAAVTCLMALTLARRSGQPASELALGVGLFGLGPIALLATGELRFGSPLETGQLLNVSYIPTDQFAKMFGYPFWYEPPRSAAAELFSSLFLADAHWNGVEWYRSGIHPWQSETLRFREFYFSTFTPAVVAVLVLSWVGVAAAYLSRRRVGDARIGTAALWSFGVFGLLVAFYLWAPSMTSRYAVDFAPPIAIGIAGFFLLLFELAGAARSRALSAAVALCGSAWVLHDVASAAVSPSHATRLLVTADEVRERLPRPVLAGPPLPDAYRCGENPERFGVKFNGSGWVSTGDCSVDAGSMFFLPTGDCIRVDVAPIDGGAPFSPEQTGAIRAKIGLTELDRVGIETTDGGTRATFCAPAGHTPNARGIDVVYLGWMDPRLVRRGVRPLRLLDVAVVTR